MARDVDSSFWTIAPAFGPAGGPREHQLTDAGRARAWSVGARVRQGPPADALAELSSLGGEALLSTRDGARLSRTGIGKRFAFGVAWGHLLALGYVESFRSDAGDGVRLTAAGVRACADGRDEIDRLLARVRVAHPIPPE